MLTAILEYSCYHEYSGSDWENEKNFFFKNERLQVTAFMSLFPCDSLRLYDEKGFSDVVNSKRRADRTNISEQENEYELHEIFDQLTARDLQEVGSKDLREVVQGFTTWIEENIVSQMK